MEMIDREGRTDRPFEETNVTVMYISSESRMNIFFFLFLFTTNWAS